VGGITDRAGGGGGGGGGGGSSWCLFSVEARRQDE